MDGLAIVVAHAVTAVAMQVWTRRRSDALHTSTSEAKEGALAAVARVRELERELMLLRAHADSVESTATAVLDEQAEHARRRVSHGLLVGALERYRAAVTRQEKGNGRERGGYRLWRGHGGWDECPTDPSEP